MSQQLGALNPLLARKTSWPAAPHAPSENANVLLIFHGLMVFAFNQDEGTCEVGIHGRAPDHDFGIFVLEYDSADSTVIYPRNPDQRFDVPAGPVYVDVARPVTPGVGFYQPPMQNNALDPQDWRRVPDFEGPLFYNRPLDKKLNALKTRLYVKQGLFFTGAPTSLEFTRVAEDNASDTLELGAVSYLIAADVSHAPGGYVTLKVGPDDIRLQAEGDKKFLIYFANVCPPDECKFDPGSPIKERRNDFHLYYKLFNRPAGRSEFDLILKSQQLEAAKANAATPFLKGFIFDILNKLAPFSNQDAPCGGSGCSQSSGFGSTLP